MHASRQEQSIMPKSLYYGSVPEVEAFGVPQFQTLDHKQWYGESTHRCKVFVKTEPYCTLDSSSPSSDYTIQSFPSNINPSFRKSPMCRPESYSCTSEDDYSPPISGSCITDEVNDLRHKLKELETVMLGPDSDILDGFEESKLEIDSWKEIMEEALPRHDIKQVLLSCAEAVSKKDVLMAEHLMDELRNMVSVCGEPIQRLGAYMLEGLVAKLSSSGSSIYKSLKCNECESRDLLSYMHIIYEVCPYFKFGYMSANGAIAEAMKHENRVHIIDFQIAQGTQWVPLIQAFAGRPGGPPCIRLTGIDDSASAYARGGGIHIVGKRLCKLAQLCNVPFEFCAAEISGRPADLNLRPGEALAVNFAFVLHRMPDESVTTTNHRDRLLRMVKSLNPKVVTLVEQESNTNTSPFYQRFVEALDYYSAMFESMDAILPRGHKERINMEQHCLARDVVNVVACKGNERVERHELLVKWKSRFRMAGFTPSPLSSLVNATIKSLLDKYSDRCRLEERDGALYLGWMNRDLVASCAWK